MGKSIRIISLLPSGTEIVYALGLEQYLVGRSHECDYPKEVQKLPVCSQPKYRSEGTSAEINRSVEEILRDALSIYTVDVEMIKALKPTHILTQSQCEVCAISTGELQNALKEVLREQDMTVIDSNPHSLGQIFCNIQEVADAANVSGAGESMVEELKTTFDEIRNRTKNIKPKPTVAHIEWIEPVMVGGHWMMSLIEWAGGRNCFPDEYKRWISFGDIVAQNPEKIVIAPCGFSIERSLQDMFYFEQKKEWRTLDAFKNNEVYVCDGSSYFNRPGPRLADSLEILTEIYHPTLFSRKYNDLAWIRRTYQQGIDL